MSPHGARYTKTGGGKAGFTLLEVLIAAGVFAVVTSLALGSYQASVRLWAAGRAQSETFTMARVTLARLTDDLQGVHVPGEPKEPPEESPFRGEERLTFLSRTRLPEPIGGPAGGLRRIRYETRPMPGGPGLALYRIEAPEQMPLPPAGEGGWVISDTLSQVRFGFVDDDGTVHRQWDIVDERFHGRLPVAVAVELTFYHPASPKQRLRFQTHIALPLALETHAAPQ